MTTRRILLVLFCLLAVATSASAECAWVLWKDTLQVSTPRPFTVWTLFDAFEAKAECEGAKKRSLARALGRPAPPGMVKEIKGDSVVTRKPDAEAVFRDETFWCLPSGTDPRPRFKED